MMPSVRLTHIFMAILFNADRRDHSSTAQLEPMSPPHSKTFIAEIPTHLPELNGNVLCTIFARLADNGALPLGPCLFVCRNWYDLTYATKMLWSTITIDEMFFGCFCTHHTRFQEYSVVHFVHTCIERSPPADTRLSWDQRGLARHVCNKFGSPRRPLLYLEKWVTKAVTLNRREAFKRCSDLTLTWEQGSPLLHSVIGHAIDELPGPRKLAIRNGSMRSRGFSAGRIIRSRKSQLRIEHALGPMKGDAESFPSLQRVSMHNTRRWGPKDLLALGRFLFVKHLSLGSDDFTIDENASPDISHYGDEALPTESVNLPHLVSLCVWGDIPFSVLRVLGLPNLGDLYVEQDMRGMTSLPQLTRTPIPSQIGRLRVVSSGRFTFTSWDGDLNRFLELAGKNIVSIMIEKWGVESGGEGARKLDAKVQVPGFRCSLNEWRG